MKRFFLAILACILILPGIGQETLKFRFNNAKVTGSEPARLQFDIEIMSENPGTYQSDLQVFFDYSTAAFGKDISKNKKLTVSKLELMDGKIGDEEKYLILNITDSNEGRIAIMSEYNTEAKSQTPDFYNMVPNTWKGLFRISIEIKNPSATAGIKFCESQMADGEYYVTQNESPKKYSKITCENDLLKQGLK
jgi:hypothetical protein